MATPRILHCADIGQRPASDRMASAFVRIPAPLVLKHPPPSPTGGCAPSTRSARSAPACGCRPPWSNRCCGPPHPPVQGGTRDVALRPDLARGLAVLVQLHDPAFELLLIMTWTTRIGHDHQLLRCPALNKPSNTLEPIHPPIWRYAIAGRYTVLIHCSRFIQTTMCNPHNTAEKGNANEPARQAGHGREDPTQFRGHPARGRRRLPSSMGCPTSTTITTRPTRRPTTSPTRRSACSAASSACSA